MEAPSLAGMFMHPGGSSLSCHGHKQYQNMQNTQERSSDLIGPVTWGTYWIVELGLLNICGTTLQLKGALLHGVSCCEWAKRPLSLLQEVTFRAGAGVLGTEHGFLLDGTHGR